MSARHSAGPDGETKMDAIKLSKGEQVEILDVAAGERFRIRRQDGTVLEASGDMPGGYWVGDYFGDGGYLGADADGVEPKWVKA